MTDPASAIKRELEITADELTSTLRQETPLTAEDFNVYYARLPKRKSAACWAIARKLSPFHWQETAECLVQILS